MNFLLKFAGQPMISSTVAGVALLPAPIDPGWIEAGEPKARSAVVALSEDRGAWTVLWECTSGRFTWRYDVDETAHVLEGSVVISAPGMAARRHGPGDTIHFSRGAVATWEVEGVVRKVAFCRLAPSRPMGRVMRLARGVHRRLCALLFGGRPRRALADT